MAEDRILTDEELREALARLPGWEVRDGWLRRAYGTPGWSHTLMLANAVAFLAEAAYHHPDLSLGYAQVTVKLQTHRVRGITASDVELAEKIHEVATWKPSGGALAGYPKKWIH
jgi:4a-hydroxytetrahydrobiopterin dehydratase